MTRINYMFCFVFFHTWGTFSWLNAGLSLTLKALVDISSLPPPTPRWRVMSTTAKMTRPMSTTPPTTQPTIMPVLSVPPLAGVVLLVEPSTTTKRFSAYEYEQPSAMVQSNRDKSSAQTQENPSPRLTRGGKCPRKGARGDERQLLTRRVERGFRENPHRARGGKGRGHLHLTKIRRAADRKLELRECIEKHLHWVRH